MEIVGRLASLDVVQSVVISRPSWPYIPITFLCYSGKLLLMHYDFVFFATFSVVLVLKFKTVHRLQSQIKDVLFSFNQLLALLFSCLLESLASIKTFLHQFVDIDIACKV